MYVFFCFLGFWMVLWVGNISFWVAIWFFWMVISFFLGWLFGFFLGGYLVSFWVAIWFLFGWIFGFLLGGYLVSFWVVIWVLFGRLFGFYVRGYLILFVLWFGYVRRKGGYGCIVFSHRVCSYTVNEYCHQVSILFFSLVILPELEYYECGSC